jgi:hypothetical protein
MRECGLSHDFAAPVSRPRTVPRQAICAPLDPAYAIGDLQIFFCGAGTKAAAQLRLKQFVLEIRDQFSTGW